MSRIKIPIYISEDLFKEAKKIVEQSQGEFKDVEEYVEFILKEVIKEEEKTKHTFTSKEEEKIKRRLRSLGYL